MLSSQFSDNRNFLASHATAQTALANDFSQPNPWREAAVLLARQVRRHAGAIVLAALVGAALVGLAKSVLPVTYHATAQILIDPQQNKALGDDATASTLDANAAINYVESQMGVMNSDRVLLRVIREQGLAGEPAAASREEAQESPQLSRAADFAENRALASLGRAVTVTRAERSFLVALTVAAEDPEKAARLANALVKAYGDVNRIDRAAAAGKAATEFDKRIDDVRRELDAGETQLQAFKNSHRLDGLNDGAIVERMTSGATDALSAAENREALARARLKQLDAPLTDVADVTALASDPGSRELQVLVESRVAAGAELDRLTATLGDHHPALETARSEVSGFDRRIALSLQRLRQTARAQLEEAQNQKAALNQKVVGLAAEMTRAREYDGPLHEMQDALAAKRKVLTELETRRRDANNAREAQEVDFRIVSPARAPIVKNSAMSLVPWVASGALAGAALALAALTMAALFEESAQATDVAALRSNRTAAPPAAPPAPKPAAAPAPTAAKERERFAATTGVRRRPARRERFVVGEVPLPAACMRRMTLDNLDLTALGFVTRAPSSIGREYEAILDGLPEPTGIVVVTGSNEGDARTSLAINLALTAAGDGARVALVEGAGRNPRIVRAVRGATLSPVLTGGPAYETQNGVTLVLPKAGEEGRGRIRPLQALDELVAKRAADLDLVICDGPDAAEPGASEFFGRANAIVALDDEESLARLDEIGCAPTIWVHVASDERQLRRA